MEAKETSIPLRDQEENGGKKPLKIEQNFREKRFQIAVIVLVPLCCALLIALIVVATRKHKVPEVRDICYSHGCVKAGASLLDIMNTSIDPCEDFYEFSCGKWMASYPEGARIMDSSSVKNFEFLKSSLTDIAGEDDIPESVKKIGKAFSVCSDFNAANIDYRHLNVIRKELISVGGWPMVDKNWTDNGRRWDDFYSTLVSALAISAPLSMQVFVNPFDTSQNIFHISSPSPEGMEGIDEDRVKIVAKLFGGKDNETIRRDFEEVERLEELISNMSVSHESLMDDENEYMVVTIEELDRIYPQLKWFQFLNNSFYRYLFPVAHTRINKKDKVFLLGKTYISTIIKKLATGQLSNRLLANYGTIKYLEDIFKYHSEGLSEVKTIFSRKKNPFKKNASLQWAVCLEYLMKTASPVFDYISGRYRKEATMDKQMLEYSFEAMKILIDEADWLDKETKKAVHEKLGEMNRFVNYPPWTQDAKLLDEYYEKLPAMTDNPFENKINLDLFLGKKYAQNYGERRNRKEWPKYSEMGGSLLNAFYVPDFNSVVIPAGIQIKPYFNADRPMYMNFGGMGLILGHEITHGLDKTGSRRDKYGNLKNWWTQKSHEEFEERSECFVDQYSSYTYGEDTGWNVDGNQTLSENIADNGGIRQAFLAYKLWEKDHGKEKSLPGLEQYNSYQMFFVSFARSWCCSYPIALLGLLHMKDSHSADRFRVIGSLSNMKEFSEAFNCKKGSSMNPENKCIIW